MNCPHCNKQIDGFTGLQELQKFHRHLAHCRKNPQNQIVPETREVFNYETGKFEYKETGRTIVMPASGTGQTLNDALKLRADSGQ